ncbi:histone-lysine N-methyltransferase SETD2 [Trichonephila clavipes]|nr:histone-lysine N-methyltransferase SETD2 [Trichonephila clavipes]
MLLESKVYFVVERWASNILANESHGDLQNLNEISNEKNFTSIMKKMKTSDTSDSETDGTVSQSESILNVTTSRQDEMNANRIHGSVVNQYLEEVCVSSTITSDVEENGGRIPDVLSRSDEESGDATDLNKFSDTEISIIANNLLSSWKDLKPVVDRSAGKLILANPREIFNLQEHGLQMNNEPGGIIVKKGLCNIHHVTSGKMGETITVVVCCNAEVFTCILSLNFRFLKFGQEDFRIPRRERHKCGGKSVCRHGKYEVCKHCSNSRPVFGRNKIPVIANSRKDRSRESFHIQEKAWGRRSSASEDKPRKCRNCGGGDRGRVAIYRPFGELRRAKIVLSPVWCSRPTTGVPLAHATMNFVGLDLTASDRWHQKTTTTTMGFPIWV